MSKGRVRHHLESALIDSTGRFGCAQCNFIIRYSLFDIRYSHLREKTSSLLKSTALRVGVRGLPEPIFPHPNPLPEGEGTLSQQHCRAPRFG